MKRREFNTHIATAIGLAPFGAVNSVNAQTFPKGPIKIIVPFPAGGTADFIARLAAAQLTLQLQSPFVVENRAGANGNIGTELVARATPDGQTLLLGSTPNLAINPSLYKRVGFDALKDFSPIAQLALAPNVLVIHPSIKANNLSQFIALAKQNPGSVRFASGGNGSTGHLAMELLNQAAEIQTLHVPYRGGPHAATDLIGGQVDALFFTVPTILPHVQSGRLKALAVASPQRAAAMPDVPTFAELGLSAVNASPWFGLLAPAGTPDPVVQRLQALLLQSWQTDEVRARLADAGAEPLGQGAEAFGRILAADVARWSEVVKRSGASID